MKKAVLLVTFIACLFASRAFSQGCTASFTYTTGSNGLLHFTSTSTGINTSTKFTWYFGDGNGVHNVADTGSYNYCFDGVYQVSLVLQDSGFIGSCFDSTSMAVNISGTPNAKCLPANFTYTVNGGQVSFTQSSSASYLFWDFGDYNSPYNYVYTTNPSHNYTHNGTYTVKCITMYPYPGFNVYLNCDTFSQTVQVTSVPCVAQFVADSNNSNGKLYLYNYAQGADSIFYSANGSTWVKGATYPAIVDSFMNLSAGYNTICQKIYGNACSDSLCKNVWVNCSISETHTISCGQVTFNTNSSSSITSAAWYIGGNVVSTQANPVISFTNTSSFYLTYTLQTSLCTKTDSAYIQVGPTPMFWVYPDSIQGPHYWLVTVDNQASYTNYLWDWGDGTTSNTPFPSHNYTIAGWYTICLTITDNCGLSAQYCQNDSLYRSANTMIGMTVQPQNQGVGVLSMEKSQLLIYPVPVNDELWVENMSEECTLSLYDAGGRMILQQRNETHSKASLALKGMAAGFYILRIQSAEGTIQKKIIKD